MSQENESPAVTDPNSRIEYLESQVEGLKRVGILGLLLVFVIGAFLVHLSWSDMKGVTTQGLVLQDANKEFAGAITVAESGHIAILPVNAMKMLPDKLSSYDKLDLHGLGIYDSQGRLRILLGVDSNDKTFVGILDENGKPQWTPLPQAAPAPGTTPAPGQTPTASPSPRSTP